MSFVEAVANVAVGYGLAVATQLAVFPVFGLLAKLRSSFLTGVSLPVDGGMSIPE